MSLILGSSLGTAKPALREANRDTAGERVAVRHLTASLAKAVRQLVGSDQHKPGVQVAIRPQEGFEGGVAGRVLAEAESAPRVPLLRSGLLNLPPPILTV